MDNSLVTLCIDTYKNRVQNFSSNEANEVIRKAFIDLIGTDKPDYRTFRNKKNEIFEVIEITLDQSITDGFSGDFFDAFVEYRDLNLGDTNEFYVPDRSLLSVSKLAGGHWEMRRQRLDAGTSFTVSTNWYGVTIYESFLRLLAGRIDWAEFVNKVARSIDNFIAELTHTAFMGSMTYLPSEFKCTGTFNKDAFLTMCEHVQAANKNSEITIVGTRSALSKLTGAMADTWSDDMKNQSNTLGHVTYYEGYKTMVLPQAHKTNTFDFAIDNGKLLVVPTNVKPIKIVREGQTLIDEANDGKRNRDMSIDYEVLFKLGIAVVFNTLYGMSEIA